MDRRPLRYMPPRSPADNIANRGSAYAKHTSERIIIGYTGHATCPNYANGRHGKFRLRPTVTLATSALTHHIGRVVGRRSEEQMGRIAAGAIVAPMANKRFGRWCAECYRPCIAVGMRYPVACTYVEPTITAMRSRTSPLPAGIWSAGLIHHRPKSGEWVARSLAGWPRARAVASRGTIMAKHWTTPVRWAGGAGRPATGNSTARNYSTGPVRCTHRATRQGAESQARVAGQ